ncbi:unnamed protein product [Phytophthora lilii]|uniref:Unnamed protein product n=1 Tax=Phytophthora lilii TaxID=2077276 RepID=A0A9W6WX08_9STRA|nr:unnamed protein product [Phytophthora lilii]
MLHVLVLKQKHFASLWILKGIRNCFRRQSPAQGLKLVDRSHSKSKRSRLMLGKLCFGGNNNIPRECYEGSQLRRICSSTESCDHGMVRTCRKDGVQGAGLDQIRYPYTISNITASPEPVVPTNGIQQDTFAMAKSDDQAQFGTVHEAETI